MSRINLHLAVLSAMPEEISSLKSKIALQPTFSRAFKTGSAVSASPEAAFGNPFGCFGFSPS